MPRRAPVSISIGEDVIVDQTSFGRHQVEARAGSSSFLIDEPVAAGGLGSGPNPYDLLSAALGSCALMTLRLYSEHKRWPLVHAQVRVTHHRKSLDEPDAFATEIVLNGPLDEDQKARLLEIASQCPVHAALRNGIAITTTLAPELPVVDPKPNFRTDHYDHMERACGM